MSTNAVYSRAELAELRKDAREGRPLRCPRCSRDLLRRSVPPRGEVGYVRTRVWWICPECKRSAILEARQAGHRKDA